MKRKSAMVITTMGVLIVIFILGVAIKHSPGIRKIQNKSPLPPISQNTTGEAQAKGGEGQSQNQSASGPISQLPWNNDKVFLEAQERNQAKVCLGAYQTVLPDPLPGEEENVHLGARLLSGTVVLPGQIFSQNAAIGPYSEERGFRAGPTYVGSQLKTTTGGGVCKLASTLYNVAVLSNLSIIERHAHSMPVPYVPYGQDATVSYGSKDFKFRNDTNFPVLIWAQGIDNVLYIAFYGQIQPPRIEWQHEFIERYKSSTLYRTNKLIHQGDQKVAMEGMDGGVVRSSIKIFSDSSHWTMKTMGLSYYSPLPRVVEKGGMTPAISESGKQ
ncbi:MAG TPA: VanW family protein [Syntrophomonadaceae bacterium]|nr:VanW family protein [Syntrophomonadaceae bacterium]